MKVFPAICYLIAAIGCLTGRLLEEPVSVQLDYIFKPMLMPFLAILVLVNAADKGYPNRTHLLLALFFAWGGDIALMLGRNGLYFLLGLGSFLIMQVLYIFLFKKNWTKPSFLAGQPYWMIPFLIIGIVFYILCIPKLSSDIVMLIAVFVYASALVSMTLSALNRKRKDADESFKRVFIGAVFFLVSDLMIGLDKFIVADFPYSGFAIMITYIIGQYLIVSGLLKADKA